MKIGKYVFGYADSKKKFFRKKNYKTHSSGTNMWVTWVSLGHTGDVMELNHVLKFNDGRTKNGGDTYTLTRFNAKNWDFGP